MIDVQKLAREAGFVLHRDEWLLREMLERFAALVLEEAAKVCDHLWQDDGTAMQCRDAIRSMKPKGEA